MKWFLTSLVKKPSFTESLWYRKSIFKNELKIWITKLLPFFSQRYNHLSPLFKFTISEKLFHRNHVSFSCNTRKLQHAYFRFSFPLQKALRRKIISPAGDFFFLLHLIPEQKSSHKNFPSSEHNWAIWFQPCFHLYKNFRSSHFSLFVSFYRCKNQNTIFRCNF